jgi:hypothetical protein
LYFLIASSVSSIEGLLAAFTSPFAPTRLACSEMSARALLTPVKLSSGADSEEEVDPIELMLPDFSVR